MHKLKHVATFAVGLVLISLTASAADAPDVNQWARGSDECVPYSYITRKLNAQGEFLTGSGTIQRGVWVHLYKSDETFTLLGVIGTPKRKKACIIAYGGRWMTPKSKEAQLQR